MGVIIGEGITCATSDVSTFGDTTASSSIKDVEGVGILDASTMVGEVLMNEIPSSRSNSLGIEVNSCGLDEPKSGVPVDVSEAKP